MVNIISISEHTQLLIGPSTGVTFKVAVKSLIPSDSNNFLISKPVNQFYSVRTNLKCSMNCRLHINTGTSLVLMIMFSRSWL